MLASVAGAQQLATSHKPTTSATQPANLSLQPTDKAVARINGTVLTDRDLTREMYTLFPYARQHGGDVPQELLPQLRAGALKMIEFEELVYQDALRRGVTVPPAKLQKAETDFRAQFDSTRPVPAIPEFRVQRLRKSPARKDSPLAAD